MKAYEPITLTHMQAYLLLQIVLAQHPNLVSGKLGSSRDLSALYGQLKGTPAPTAEDGPFA